MAFCQCLAKCHFVVTLTISKQQHFWPVARNFYKLSETCFLLFIVLASYPMLQNTIFKTKVLLIKLYHTFFLILDANIPEWFCGGIITIQTWDARLTSSALTFVNMSKSHAKNQNTTIQIHRGTKLLLILSNHDLPKLKTSMVNSMP